METGAEEQEEAEAGDGAPRTLWQKNSGRRRKRSRRNEPSHRASRSKLEDYEAAEEAMQKARRDGIDAQRRHAERRKEVDEIERKLAAAYAKGAAGGEPA